MDVSENGSSGELWRRGHWETKTSPDVIFVGCFKNPAEATCHLSTC